MDSNIERRDSKKSTKAGGGGNNGNKGQNRGGGGSGGGGAGGKQSGEKQRSHSQKSGKPYREIYKPPSMRTTKTRNSNSYSELQEKGKLNEEKCISSGGGNQSKKGMPSGGHLSKNNGGNGGHNGAPQNGSYSADMNLDSATSQHNGYSLFGNNNGNSSNGNGGSGSVPSSPLISSRMQQNAFNIGLANRMLNVNAKEFQFLPIQQQHQQQQISNFLSQFDPSLFYNANSPILASSGCYPLKQSKSSGNMNLLLQQQQQQQQAQAAALQQLQQQLGFSFPLQPGNLLPSGTSSGVNGGNNQFNRLSQSKSSGNVPGGGNKPRVRFDDEEVDFDDADEFASGPLGNYLASLNLNGDASGVSTSGPNFSRGYPFQQPKQNKVVPLSPQPVLKSSLQKSRTGFYLNMYGNQQQQQMAQSSPNKNLFGFGSSPSTGNTGLHHGNNFMAKVAAAPGGIGIGQQHSSFPGMSNVVKRSRSFGPGAHHLPRTSATTLLSASTQSPSSAGHSVYSDFCITKWPRVVQELVTAAVTGVDRIPARNWIEMVNGIFDAMLCDFRATKKDRNFSSNQSAGVMTTAIGSGKMCGPGSVSSNRNNEKGDAITAAGELCRALHNGEGNGDASSAAFSLSPVTNNDLGLSPDFDENEDDDEDEEDDDDDDTDLTSAAVHIFLYFIQREKERTVMESLLNTCFASFQRLSTSSLSSSNPAAPSASKANKSYQQHKKALAQTIEKPCISRQWSNFLRFLSSLYSQVKLIRRQKQSQQQPGHSMDEMSFSLLALLCDSCLATLRSPQSYTAEMMGCLFTVLTSIGRDMEGTFPLKMKQLLAAVRDALLGIGPYHQQQQQQHHYANNSNSTSSSTPSSGRLSSLSPIVQKTLMQLIELHAANWQLPASAVRYYYSSVGGGTSSGKSSATNANSSNNNNTGNASIQKGSSNVNADKRDNVTSLSPTGMTLASSRSFLNNTESANDAKDDVINRGGGGDDSSTTTDSSFDDLAEVRQINLSGKEAEDAKQTVPVAQASTMS